MRRSVFLLLALSLTAGIASAEDVVVETSGTGLSYRAAVNEALLTALESKCGVTLDSTQRSRIGASDTATSVNGVEESRVSLNDEIMKKINSVVSGRIAGYDVLSEGFDEQSKKYRVQLAVRIPGPYVVGLDPENRRRMAVVDFRVCGSRYDWYGQKGSTVEWSRTLSDRLNIALTRCRRFTMLDRRFSAEINDELARLKDSNASPADVVRCCQKLGTDYLVTGEIRFFPIAAPQVNPLTGQAAAPVSQRFAEVSFRVLLAPTGQLKFADVIKVNSGTFNAATMEEFASLSAEEASRLIVNAILTNYRDRGSEADGTEETPPAIPTVSETPDSVPPPAPPVTTVAPTAGGGVRLGF